MNEIVLQGSSNAILTVCVSANCNFIKKINPRLEGLFFFGECLASAQSYVVFSFVSIIFSCL